MFTQKSTYRLIVSIRKQSPTMIPVSPAMITQPKTNPGRKSGRGTSSISENRGHFKSHMVIWVRVEFFWGQLWSNRAVLQFHWNSGRKIFGRGVTDFWIFRFHIFRIYRAHFWISARYCTCTIQIESIHDLVLKSDLSYFAFPVFLLLIRLGSGSI